MNGKEALQEYVNQIGREMDALEAQAHRLNLKIDWDKCDVLEIETAVNTYNNK